MVSSKAFIKVKELQGRRGRLPDGRGEHSRLQGGQGSLKLGVDEGQCVLLHSQLVVQSHCLRAKNTVCVWSLQQLANFTHFQLNDVTMHVYRI